MQRKKSLWYRDYSQGGVWSRTDNDTLIKANECIQELLLWSGENQFDIEAGVDYDAIFKSDKFIIADLDKVVSKYKPYFLDIVIKPLVVDAPKVLVEILFYSPDSGGGSGDYHFRASLDMRGGAIMAENFKGGKK